MFAHFRAPRRQASESGTSELVMFNYRRPVRARLVSLGPGNGKLWLVEMLDAQSGIWIWQEESRDSAAALDCARRLSLLLS
ncbi:hypothetical protein [Paludibacterium paludis]|uniref:Uncharacterized protein n=1 Tax=Paludibacterium paludis TaxID=1225769 RepID=A0A918P1G4_9NEIS|nr:hypothetical protein [Paludibacterium paludis]GGY12536.1 hypothetical protein GCM10011289_14690 [Paludibacterium paludis]